MEQQLDGQAMLERAGEIAKQVRKSDAYPAIAGALAGVIAGGVVAALVAGRVASSRRARAAEVANVTDQVEDRSWNLREIVELAAIAAGILKQVQEWYQERQRS